MKTIMVCGPYRAKTEWELEQNIQAAERAAAKLWAEGWAVFCPHKNSAHFAGLCPDENYLEADRLFLRMCDAVYFLATWQNSEGARIEHALAQQLHKWIIYEPPVSDDTQ